MRILYLDVFAAINFAMDYLLLFAASRICGIYCTRPRLALGALIGAGYAVCSVQFPSFNLLPAQLLTSAAMVQMSFRIPSRKTFARVYILFLALCCAAAGAALALGHISQTSFLAGGGYYVQVPFRVVAGAMALSWVLSGYIFRNSARETVLPRASAQVEMVFQGKTAAFQLLVDTGNTLSDPISGRPACVIDRKSAALLLPVQAACALTRLHPDNAAEILSELPKGCHFRLLPFHAVGKSSGFLLAFSPEQILVDGKVWNGLAAISAEPIANGQYQGLIGL